MAIRTLLVDNYDSFTYNLFQLISVVNGVAPTVVRNDEFADLDELGLDGFDNIVISPGPGHPARRRDFGISAELIARAEQPLLGVCLGHQGIVVAAGGTVGRAPQPRHGYLDRVAHSGTELFDAIPPDFTVVRYHSLAAEPPLPPALEATAWSSDGVIMALRHRDRPQWGVQFHPESIASEHGHRLLRNFASLSGSKPRTRKQLSATLRRDLTPRRYRLNTAVLPRAVDTESAFELFYGASPHAFWLDSERIEPGLDRFSFLGDTSGPLAQVVRYNVGDGFVDVDGEQVPGTVFDYLGAQLRVRTVGSHDLPFDFACGYVGWFGYEMKADCGSPNRHVADTDDACWLFADRMLVVDHVAGNTYALALDDDTDGSRASARAWLAATLTALDAIPSWQRPAHERAAAAEVEPLLDRDRERYLADIAVCDEKLRAGESYEICLTNALTVPDAVSGWELYRALRHCNPAPYAAYLRVGDVSVACSSPERFLKIDRLHTVESKPIKGTAPRGTTAADDARLAAELAQSPKTRAENLMIVDLLRNDLGRVCETGTVAVPTLMAVESYPTVHQLVSTVRGRLRPGVTPIDCVRACFPGGSMTGAPKLRTMEIIDTLETRARGIYSGTVGFLGLGGTADLNIVIRTAVHANGQWRVGAGGAIVLDSDPAAEFHEMTLKAGAVLRAFAHAGKQSANQRTTVR